MKQRLTTHLKRAFSLTEVTVALGIIGFCAIAVMGLLPVAVQTHRRGHDQTQAAAILGNFLAGFQAPVDSTNSPPGTFALPYPFTNTSCSWQNGGSSNDITVYFTPEGTSTNGIAGSRYILAASLTPPGSNGFGGIVSASVSWPSQATNNKYIGTLQGAVYFNSPSSQ